MQITLSALTPRRLQASMSVASFPVTPAEPQDQDKVSMGRLAAREALRIVRTRRPCGGGPPAGNGASVRAARQTGSAPGGRGPSYASCVGLIPATNRTPSPDADIEAVAEAVAAGAGSGRDWRPARKVRSWTTPLRHRALRRTPFCDVDAMQVVSGIAWFFEYFDAARNQLFRRRGDQLVNRDHHGTQFDFPITPDPNRSNRPCVFATRSSARPVWWRPSAAGAGFRNPPGGHRNLLREGADRTAAVRVADGTLELRCRVHTARAGLRRHDGE